MDLLVRNNSTSPHPHLAFGTPFPCPSDLHVTSLDSLVSPGFPTALNASPWFQSVVDRKWGGSSRVEKTVEGSEMSAQGPVASAYVLAGAFHRPAVT